MANDFSRFFNNTTNSSIQKAINDRPLLDPVLDGAVKQLRKTMIDNFEPNKLEGQTQFRAVCLRGLMHVQVDGKRQIRIKARIPELHTFLPLPRFPDDFVMFSIYPTFIGSADDIGLPDTATDQSADLTSIEPGSEVEVTFGNMKNFSNPTIVRVLRHGPAAGVSATAAAAPQLNSAPPATRQPVLITHNTSTNRQIAAQVGAEDDQDHDHDPHTGILLANAGGAYVGSRIGDCPAKWSQKGVDPKRYFSIQEQCRKCGNTKGRKGTRCGVGVGPGTSPVQGPVYLTDPSSAARRDMEIRRLEILGKQWGKSATWSEGAGLYASTKKATVPGALKTARAPMPPPPLYGDPSFWTRVRADGVSKTTGRRYRRKGAYSPSSAKELRHTKDEMVSIPDPNNPKKKIKVLKEGGYKKGDIKRDKHGRPLIQGTGLTPDAKQLPKQWRDGHNGLPFQVIVHDSCQPSRKMTKAFLNGNDARLGTHFTIDLNGKIWQHVPLRRYASHTSIPGLNINSNSIGIDMLNWCAFTKYKSKKQPGKKRKTIMRSEKDLLERRTPSEHIPRKFGSGRKNPKYVPGSAGQYAAPTKHPDGKYRSKSFIKNGTFDVVVPSEAAL